MQKESNLEPEKKTESLLFRLFSNSKKSPAEYHDIIKGNYDSIATQHGVDTGADAIMEQVLSAQTGDHTLDNLLLEVQTEPQPDPLDARCNIIFQANYMFAYLTIDAPQYGGADISEEMIRTLLADRGIVNGIDEGLISLIVEEKLYGEELLIAAGKPKQDGVDGRIEEFYKRASEVKPHHNNDGTVDFKELSIINEVQEGAVISRTIAPTEGTDGYDVRGNILKAVPGKAATLQAGENTYLNEEKTKQFAGKTGHLIYKEDRFAIQTVFEVNGNVDNATGNINFNGDVVIRGDVREGFEIRSRGNVTVKGIVEGASVFAEGNVTLIGGFNGMLKGKIVSHKTITTKFLQNCTAVAKENISTESAINSNITCDGSLLVTKGKGVIAGGSCVALESIDAKIIGTPSNSPTTLMVGINSEILNQKYTLEKDLNDVINSNDLIVKNLAYLELVAQKAPLNEKQKQLLESCKKQKVINIVKEGKIKKQLERVNATIANSAQSFVKAQTLYPSTKITIVNQTLHSKSIYNKCIFRCVEGEVVVSYF